MNKTAILMLSIIIICAVASQTSPSTALATDTKIIGNYGIILQDPTPPAPLDMKIQINAWGIASPVPQSLLQQMAKFDLIATDFLVKSDVTVIKRLNPDALVIGYKDAMLENNQMDDWNTVNAHEDWFIHDTDGNRLINAAWGGYCMNIASTGWKQHVVDYINSFKVYGFDGVFIDDGWSSFFTDSWTVPISKVPAIPTWHSDMVNFILYVKAGTSPGLVIVNCPNNNDYVTAGDGKVGEEFLDMFGPWNDINALSSLSAQGKYYLAWAKGSDTRASMSYFLSGFLLGLNGPNTYFGYNNVWTTSQGYYSDFEVVKNLGAPSGNYYSYQSVYARDFVNGKVLFNPSGNRYTINLQGTYVTLDGSTVTTITINGNSGVILMQH